MNENLFEAQYDVTKKSKIKRFYESNKNLIFSFILILIISLASITYYYNSQEKKKILLSEKFVRAKIYLENDRRSEATDLLKSVINANDSTYSTLSLFLLLNQNLITDYDEISILFNQLFENNSFKKEIRDLLIYKKTLLDLSHLNESEILGQIKPLLMKNSIWKSQALLLMGDYYFSNKEYLKAKEFYIKIFSIKNLQRDIYERAKFQLASINNE